MRYHELSQAQRREIPQEELLLLLAKSVTCAILGKAGPQRSRILGTLHKVCILLLLSPSIPPARRVVNEYGSLVAPFSSLLPSLPPSFILLG